MPVQLVFPQCDRKHWDFLRRKLHDFSSTEALETGMEREVRLTAERSVSTDGAVETNRTDIRQSGEKLKT